MGTSLEVLAPPSGTEHHTLRFWSTDLAGNVESPQTAEFDVSSP